MFFGRQELSRIKAGRRKQNPRHACSPIPAGCQCVPSLMGSNLRQPAKTLWVKIGPNNQAQVVSLGLLQSQWQIKRQIVLYRVSLA